MVQGKNGRREIQLNKTENYERVTFNHPFGRKVVELLPGNIGYIRLYHVSNVDELDTAFNKLQDTKGLIIDLRGGNAPYNYRFPGDMRSILINRLIKDPFERRSFQTLYHFSDGSDVDAKGDYKTYYFPDRNSSKIFYEKPVIIITSSRQQSYGEGVLQILQSAKRVTYVGSATVGTNGGMSAVRLPDGGELTFTKDYALNPNGKPFHGIGVIPDVKIEPTIQGIRARKDEVLEKAIQVLNQKIKIEKN